MSAIQTTQMPVQVPQYNLPTADAPVDKYYKFARTQNNSIYTTSVWIAESTQREHWQVCDTIRKILANDVNGTYANDIFAGTYTDNRNREQEQYILTIGGFFVYCSRIRMTDEQINGWSSVISGLVNRVRNAYNKGINELANQLTVAKQTAAQAQPQVSDEEYIAIAVIKAQNLIKERDKIIAQQQAEIAAAQPAVQFVQAVTNRRDTITVAELANLICQELLKRNLGVGPNQFQLYAWLRGMNYVSKQKGTTWNKPRIAAIRDELLIVAETPYTDNKGEEHVGRTTRVTAKGQAHFLDEFIKIYENGGTFNDGIQKHEVRSDVHDGRGPEECVGEDSAAKGA